MLMLLLLLLLVSTAAAAAAPSEATVNFSDKYDEIPADYREEFEKVDKFSAIVRFVRDTERNATCSNSSSSTNTSSKCEANCPGRGSSFPLAAFAKEKLQLQSLRYQGFAASQQAVLSMANLINYIYQLAEKPFEKWFVNSASSESHEFQAFWYSIVSSVVASDAKIFGCYAVLVDSNDKIGKEFVPHAYRQTADKVSLDNHAISVSIGEKSHGLEWYSHHVKSKDHLVRQVQARPSQVMNKNTDNKLAVFTSRVLQNLMNGSGVKVVTEAEGIWAPPTFMCTFKRWLVSYAVPFLGGHGSKLSIRGWLVLEFDLKKLDVNQCYNASNFANFYANNICNQATTVCQHQPGQGFTDSSFRCQCKRYFHFGNFTGAAVRRQWLLHQVGASSNYSSLECGPCPAECPRSCTTDGRCLIEYDLDTLRALPLVIQTFCLTVCFLVAGIVFKTRKSRIIKSSVWILVEIFIVGLSLLYSTVFLMYMQPTYEICFIIPWLREIGFAITYGTMLVKVYKILCSFQSRKAHRVHVKDRDLLKYLAGIVAVAIGFMAAWTAATLDHARRLTSLVDSSNCSVGSFGGHLVLEDGAVTERRLGFRACAVGYWDAVCAVGELAFLLVGLFYCYCVRSSPSDKWEVRCTTAAFCCELLFSLTYHAARHFVWQSLHPDYMYLMYFARCHLTVTITAALVLGPKLWYVHSPPKNSLNQRNLLYSQVDSHLGDAMGQVALATNGDVEALEINLSDMNPEDIRAELKRLYTQNQILKTKVMRRDNPHISKRKGGRKQTHRRNASWRVQSFSLQPFYHKHAHKSHTAASVQEEEASKVSEDSSNSAEGQEVAERPAGKESTATSSSSCSK